MEENAALLIRFRLSPDRREDGAGGRVVSTNFIMSSTIGLRPAPFTPPFFRTARGWPAAPLPGRTLADAARFLASAGVRASWSSREDRDRGLGPAD